MASSIARRDRKPDLRKVDELLNHDLDIPRWRMGGLTDRNQAQAGRCRRGSWHADGEFPVRDLLAGADVTAAHRRERRSLRFPTERMCQSACGGRVSEHILRDALELQDVLRILVAGIAPRADAD